MGKRITALFIGALCLAGGLAAQTPQPILKGKVIDRGGETVIGAHVKWKNAQGGAVTDLDGNFSIPETGTELVISFLGYKTQTIKIKPGQKNLVVTLEDDAQDLDELVVVGYGTQKKASLTGSIETIKSEDLLSLPTANLDEALYGQVAGLQVMQTTGDPSSAKEANLHIRGINNSPLLVIDGVPRFGTTTSDGEMRLSDLNPDDIESISILKDAAAAAVYGARAANGVILVQTKRASGNQKVSVNYRGQMNIQQATQLPDFLDAYEYAKLYNRAVENTPGTTNTAYTPEQLEMIRTHSNPNVYGDENLLDYLDNVGYTTTHSVSANGGNQYVKYYISGGYTHSKGLYSGVNRDRFNYSAKLDATLTKGLVLSLDLTGSRSNSKNSSYTTIDNAYNFSPLQVLRFDNGYLASADGSNPLINVEGLGGYIKDTGKMNTITANLRWELPWVKGLSVYARATFDNNTRIEKTFNKPVTLYTYDQQTGQFDTDPNTVYPTAKVSIEQIDRFVDNQLYEAGINYNRTFAAKHDVGAMLVANYQQTHNQYMTGENQNASIYPETIGTAVTARLLGSETYNQRASLIGRLNYGYDYRYFVEASFRVDGSTYFHPDHRWGFFPSVSASWVLSNETFFKNWKQKVLSNVKTRGIVGEYQLGALIDDILTRDQFEENVITKKGSTTRVEYAIKMPGEDGSFVYLPVDSKFPGDVYAQLVDAYDAGDPAAIAAAQAMLTTRIKGCAKDIRDKYIDPPNTTDFGIMFLPFEGLYAEVVRLGLVEVLQRQYKVNIAGPTTFAALLNSLQMGFRTLAIQKRSSEVWSVLGAVKTEFATFEDVLAAAQKRIEQTGAELDKLVGVRTRKINSRLRSVSVLPAEESARLLDDGADAE